MSSARVLNYHTDCLKINGLEVGCLTMVGLLTERIPKIARELHINFDMVREADLPNHLLLSLDGLRGARKVGLKEADKMLSLAIARVVREQLRSLGLSMVDCCVEVFNPGGKKLGEHDMTMEVEGGKGALRQHMSVELKLRRLWTERETEKRRIELREESVGGRVSSTGNCSWWQQEQDKYSGRLLVLVVFPERQASSVKFKVNADIKLNGEEQWGALLGWAGSRRTLVPARSAPPAEPAQPAQAPQPAPAQQALRKRPAREAFQRDVPALSFEDCWRKARKSGQHACVKDVLAEMDTVKAGRSYPTVGERAPRWQRRFQWAARSWKQKCADFSGHRSGGSPGVGCAKAAMENVYALHV